MVLSKEIKEKLMTKFGQHAGDTGSVEVQISLLTENIRQLTEHLKKNKKDVSSKRGLIMQVSRRRSFLDYLAKRDPERYAFIIKQLDIKS